MDLSMDAQRNPPSEEMLSFGNRMHRVLNGRWDTACVENFKLFQPVSLTHWIVFHEASMETESKGFVNRLMEISRGVGLKIEEPVYFISEMENIRETVVQIDEFSESKPQLILFMLKTDENEDLISAMIRYCVQCGIQFETATKSNLRNEDRFTLTKIACRLCAKLGGAPWSVHNPLSSSMAVGFNVLRDSQTNVSYGSLVAAMDFQRKMNFFSIVSNFSQNGSMTIVNGVINAIYAYKKQNAILPSKIFIYRAVVNDQDMAQLEVEIEILRTALKECYGCGESEPRWNYIVVKENLGTEMLVKTPKKYNFFIPTRSLDGNAVSFTEYNILLEKTSLRMDKLRLWSYKQSHLYFNSFGVIGVPAVLQYATDLSQLCSKHVLYNDASNKLKDKFWFL